MANCTARSNCDHFLQRSSVQSRQTQTAVNFILVIDAIHPDNRMQPKLQQIR